VFEVVSFLSRRFSSLFFLLFLSLEARRHLTHGIGPWALSMCDWHLKWPFPLVKGRDFHSHVVMISMSCLIPPVHGIEASSCSSDPCSWLLRLQVVLCSTYAFYPALS
jgi:hypothetical protein